MSGIAGFRNPGCYANALRDCSSKLTLEHSLVPKHVLRNSKSREILVTGQEWQTQDVMTVGANSLASKVLCEAHNGRLSPLDVQFGRLHRHVVSSARYLTSGAPHEFIFNGHDIERWMLKSLCGWIAARPSKGRRRFEISPGWLMILFGLAPMPADCGLYVGVTGIDTAPSIPHHPMIPPERARDGMAFTPRYEVVPSMVLDEPCTTFFTGCDHAFNGLQLTLSMTPLDSHKPTRRLMWRPSELRWYLDGSDHPATSLRFQWQQGSGRTVALRTRLESVSRT